MSELHPQAARFSHTWLHVPRLVPALTLVLTVVLPASASAQLELTWSAPDGCPDGVAVRAEVDQLLSAAPSDAQTVRATATASRDGERFHLVLETEVAGTPGERALDADRCDELASATALILALMIDPTAALAAEPEPAAEPHAEQRVAEPSTTSLIGETSIVNLLAAAPERTATEYRMLTRSTRVTQSTVATADRAQPADRDDVRAEGAPEDQSLRGFLGLRGVFDIGSLPTATGGLALEGGVGIPLIDARVRATFLFPSVAGLDSFPDAGANTYSFSAEALACVRPFDEARAIGACGGLMVGVVVGEGFGVPNPQTGVGTYLGAVVGLELRWDVLDWLDLALDADLLVPFSPLELAVQLDGSDLVFFRQEPVAGRFALAARVRL